MQTPADIVGSRATLPQHGSQMIYALVNEKNCRVLSDPGGRRGLYESHCLVVARPCIVENVLQ